MVMTLTTTRHASFYRRFDFRAIRAIDATLRLEAYRRPESKYHAYLLPPLALHAENLRLFWSKT